MARVKKRGHSRQKTRSKAFKILSTPRLGRLNILFIFLIIGILIGGLPLFESGVEADLNGESLAETGLVIFQDNSLAPISNPSNPESPAVRKITVIITGYSSTEDQTDSDPFITAAGTAVRDGIVANNFLSIGTKIRIPELYGDKIFVVEDRMSWKKGSHHIDIWFPDYWQALNFGAKRTYIEILES